MTHNYHNRHHGIDPIPFKIDGTPQMGEGLAAKNWPEMDQASVESKQMALTYSSGK